MQQNNYFFDEQILVKLKSKVLKKMLLYTFCYIFIINEV